MQTFLSDLSDRINCTQSSAQYLLLFVHERNSWSVRKLWEFFYTFNLPDYISIFIKIEKKKKKNITRGISLINVVLKVMSKIITDRISNFALSHDKIRPEQFVFISKEEYINLFISIRKICQRRKFQGKFTYVSFFWILKKPMTLSPTYNILQTKLYKLDI